MENTDLNLYVKENNLYINIPTQILNQGSKVVSIYIKAYSEIENLKETVTNYLFDKTSKITPLDIMNRILKIKSDESINEVIPFLELDINLLEERLINVCTALGVNLDELSKMRDDLANSYISTEHGLENIISESYVSDIMDYIKSDDMYSLNERSTYGTMSKEYNLKNIDDISDLNNTEINGRYSPILVIYKPAKYNRGTYVLENTSYVYIKRQPLDALVKQERLEERGTDSMGAILYKKLDHHLTNENLQELLAELYVYSKKNNVQFENIKLSDIGDNKVWMTGEKLKKEFKELRYYNKNLSQKLKEIYDTTSSYYTQIGGKYIFNSRELLRNYKAYKDKEIKG